MQLQQLHGHALVGQDVTSVTLGVSCTSVGRQRVYAPQPIKRTDYLCQLDDVKGPLTSHLLGLIRVVLSWPAFNCNFLQWRRRLNNLHISRIFHLYPPVNLFNIILSLSMQINFHAFFKRCTIPGRIYGHGTNARCKNLEIPFGLLRGFPLTAKLKI